MTFLNLWALGFAGLAPIIVLLYLLKVKRRRASVSTLLFWQRVLQENRRRALFQKLRQMLSLLLHLVIFSLILGALMRPVFDRYVRQGGAAVLIVDTRARMQAKGPDGSTRFSRAKLFASAFVREANGALQTALMSMNAAPVVVTPFTEDESALQQGIDTLQATDAGGDLESAIRLGESLLASRKGERRIVVLTDGAPKSGDKHSDGIVYVPCGTAADNVAITRFATRPLLSSPETSEVLLEIANFSGKSKKGNVEVSLDGRLLDVKPFDLPAGARRVEIFPSVSHLAGKAKGWLVARMDSPDALTLDNTAYAVLSAKRPVRTLLVTTGNWFLEKLLAADEGVAFELVKPTAYSHSLASKFDVVILDRFLPTGLDLQSLRANYLFIGTSLFEDGKAPLVDPLISHADADHPALRLVDLRSITIARATSLTIPRSAGWKWQSPIRSFDHPLMITGEILGSGPERRTAALAFNVTDSDLPLRIAFPLLISNTIHWLAGDQMADIPGAQAGAMLRIGKNESISLLPERPEKAARQVTQTGSGTAGEGLFQPMRNGFYRIDRPDGAHWLAVNTFDAAESDLRGAQVAGDRAPNASRMRLANVASWPAWEYLAFAAFLLFSGEWWLFHRRRTE